MHIRNDILDLFIRVTQLDRFLLGNALWVESTFPNGTFRKYNSSFVWPWDNMGFQREVNTVIFRFAGDSHTYYVDLPYHKYAQIIRGIVLREDRRGAREIARKYSNSPQTKNNRGLLPKVRSRAPTVRRLGMVHNSVSTDDMCITPSA